MAVTTQGAMDEIQNLQKKTLADEFGGRQSNQFVAELKGSTLFQFSWGELLSAAPTALSLMGAIWIAAAAPRADEIDMTDSVPIGGFKYLTNNKRSTLRSCLVDVCNRGGRDAFMTASANMDALQIRSQRICEERIDIVFQRLNSCTDSDDALEDFKDALTDFGDEARQCAKLATETRVAFSTWGKMVGELHACTENQTGAVSRERTTVAVKQDLAVIEEKFSTDAARTAKDQVAFASKQLEKAEQRLNTTLDKVPGPWESVIQGAVSGFTQALPSIVAGVLPAVLAAANPASALTGTLAGVLKPGVAPTAPTSNGGDQPKQSASTPAPAPSTASDPAYASALTSRELISNFYEFLGGENGQTDWTKLMSPETTTSSSATEKEKPDGVTYFLGNLSGQKHDVAVTGTDPNKKLLDAYERALKVATEIQDRIQQTGFKTEAVSADVIKGWKASVKIAKDEVLQLASVGNTLGSGSSPNAFANLNIKIPPMDHTAQTAQVNGAMQAAQMAQTAADAAQDNYDSALAKQAQTAAAMAEVQQKLKSLQEKGKTLDEIKSVLRDCVSVLVDLAIQVGKLETFFTMLTTVIDNVVLVRAADFTKNMEKGANRSRRNGYLTFDKIAKQTIYTSTLQLKAYFSLLQDIASMYCLIDKEYIKPGTELCMKLSKGASTGTAAPELADELGRFTQDSAKAVKALVDDKQAAMVKGLRDRAMKAAASTQLIETTVANHGISVDQGASAAIQAGRDASNQEARALLNAANSETVSKSDTVDISAL